MKLEWDNDLKEPAPAYNTLQKTDVQTLRASFTPIPLSEMPSFNEEIEHVKME